MSRMNILRELYRTDADDALDVAAGRVLDALQSPEEDPEPFCPFTGPWPEPKDPRPMLPASER